MKTYGFYSEQAAELCGTIIYLSEGGGEVEVTCIDNNQDIPSYYKWDDVKRVGVVTKYVRQGRPGLLMRRD